MYYAGIGSREVPQEAKWEIHKIAYSLANERWTLRSGGAPGADIAFEYGCGDGAKEIFLPWKNFNENPSLLFDIPDKAFEISAQHHPRWKFLREPIRRLMARNAQQVLGKNLDTPVEFVVCWTPDGCTKGEERTKDTGGTGQAIAIASAHNIPVFNLQRGSIEIEMMYEYLGQRNL